jgi:hypothetical protein
VQAQRGDSEGLMSEETEAAAYFACRNARSAEAEMRWLL